MVRDLADRYSAALLRAQLQHPAATFTLTSVVPPARWFVAGCNEFPVYGPLWKRVRIDVANCNDSSSPTQRSSGSRILTTSISTPRAEAASASASSDSNVRINSDHAEPIARALERQSSGSAKPTFLPAKSAKVSLQATSGGRASRSALDRYHKTKLRSQLRRIWAQAEALTLVSCARPIAENHDTYPSCGDEIGATGSGRPYCEEESASRPVSRVL